MGYGRQKKMVQGKDMLNEKPSLPCWHWCHGPLFFLHRFLRFVLLLLLHHNGKLAIPHNHLFLIIQILHLSLFKLLQRQVELNISGDSHVFFWWARDGNHCLSSLRRSDLPFFWNLFVAIYFQPLSVSKSCPPFAVTMRRGWYRYRWQDKIFWDIGLCHWPRRWCTM